MTRVDIDLTLIEFLAAMEKQVPLMNSIECPEEYAMVGNNDWIVWQGKEIPVLHPATLVEVFHVNGVTVEGRVDEFQWTMECDPEWTIFTYRALK
jgi:hypothetical protein